MEAGEERREDDDGDPCLVFQSRVGIRCDARLHGDHLKFEEILDPIKDVISILLNMQLGMWVWCPGENVWARGML